MIMISDGEQTAGADGLLRNKVPDFMQKSKVINELGKKNKCFQIKDFPWFLVCTWTFQM